MNGPLLVHIHNTARHAPYLESRNGPMVLWSAPATPPLNSYTLLPHLYILVHTRDLQTKWQSFHAKAAVSQVHGFQVYTRKRYIQDGAFLDPIQKPLGRGTASVKVYARIPFTKKSNIFTSVGRRPRAFWMGCEKVPSYTKNEIRKNADGFDLSVSVLLHAPQSIVISHLFHHSRYIHYLYCL